MSSPKFLRDGTTVRDTPLARQGRTDALTGELIEHVQRLLQRVLFPKDVDASTRSSTSPASSATIGLLRQTDHINREAKASPLRLRRLLWNIFDKRVRLVELPGA